MFACVYVRMCVYARVRVSLYDSMRASMPVCMRLWVCMYACERVLFIRLWVACVCVYKDRDLYSQNSNGS